jgi:hypothetical protein
MSTGPPEPRDAPGPSPVPGPDVEITVRTGRFLRTVFAVCVALEIALVLLDYHVNYGGLTQIGSLRRLTNITREDSLASWVGTTQTLLVAVTLWLLYVAVRSRPVETWRRRGWLVLAIFFTFMAADDGALLHERAGTVFSQIHSSDAPGGEATEIGARALDAFPSYAWQIVVLPLFVVLGLFALLFLWRELDSHRARVAVVVALACFAAAVGLDFVEGLDEDHPWNLYTRLTEWIDFGDYTEYRFGNTAFDTLRHFSKSIEEFLEMFGGTLLWLVFLHRLTQLAPTSRIRFVE